MVGFPFGGLQRLRGGVRGPSGLQPWPVLAPWFHWGLCPSFWADGPSCPVVLPGFDYSGSRRGFQDCPPYIGVGGYQGYHSLIPLLRFAATYLVGFCPGGWADGYQGHFSLTPLLRFAAPYSLELHFVVANSGWICVRSGWTPRFFR